MIATGRSLLRLAAKELLEELAAQTRGIPIRLVPRINLQVTETNGWSCNIASLGKGRPRLELWFDHYADHRSRRFWFGFYSPKKTEINRLIVRAPSFLRPYRRQIFSNDIEKTKEDDWRLRKPLSKSDFGLTFHEQYANTSHYFFGIFDRQAITSRRKLRLLTKRAAVFATDVVRNLPQMKPPDRDNIVYPRIENRKMPRHWGQAFID